MSEMKGFDKCNDQSRSYLELAMLHFPALSSLPLPDVHAAIATAPLFPET